MIIIYTILLKSDNELIISKPERIMCRSKLVDNFHFLVEPDYKGVNMAEFTVTMEYVLPVSKSYHTESLILSEDTYKDYLEYKIPFDTALTKEPGKIEVQLVFTKVEMGDDGELIQRVRRTGKTTITITPIEAWSDFIPDEALLGIDQRLLKADAMIQQLVELLGSFDDTKADNISLKDSILQLLSKGTPIGDKINLSQVEHDCNTNENVKVVEF